MSNQVFHPLFQPGPGNECGVRCWSDKDCATDMVCKSRVCTGQLECKRNSECLGECVSGQSSLYLHDRTGIEIGLLSLNLSVSQGASLGDFLLAPTCAIKNATLQEGIL